MTTPTDDELLALAKKAANAYGGGAPWEQYFAAVKDPAAIIALIERHRADADAGREFMRAAWQECNAIRAKDGAPEGVSEVWWDELTEALGKLLGDDRVPWMLGAAKELVRPYEARAEKAEAEVERLTRERDALRSDALHWKGTSERHWVALAAERKRCGRLYAALEEAAGRYPIRDLKRVRAALAGKDARVANDQKSCQPAGDSRSAGEP